jgi:hypothetical protein
MAVCGRVAKIGAGVGAVCSRAEEARPRVIVRTSTDGGCGLGRRPLVPSTTVTSFQCHRRDPKTDSIGIARVLTTAALAVRFGALL